MASYFDARASHFDAGASKIDAGEVAYAVGKVLANKKRIAGIKNRCWHQKPMLGRNTDNEVDPCLCARVMIAHLF